MFRSPIGCRPCARMCVDLLVLKWIKGKFCKFQIWRKHGANLGLPSEPAVLHTVVRVLWETHPKALAPWVPLHRLQEPQDKNRDTPKQDPLGTIQSNSQQTNSAKLRYIWLAGKATSFLQDTLKGTQTYRWICINGRAHSLGWNCRVILTPLQCSWAVGFLLFLSQWWQG